MNGWIKMNRNLLDWEWYQDSKMVHLFVHMLLKANHRPKKWKGKVIDTGQFVSGRFTLSAETGISQQSIRTCLKKLKSTNVVTIESTKQYSIFTIINWKKYQVEPEPLPELTIDQPTANQQLTTTKKERSKEGKKFIKPEVYDVQQYCKERKNNINPQTFIDFYESKGWMIGKNKMKDWKAAVRTWERSQTQARPNVIVPKSKDLTNYGRE